MAGRSDYTHGCAIISCGVYDPDCSNGALPVLPLLVPSRAPSTWICPDMYYNDGQS